MMKSMFLSDSKMLEVECTSNKTSNNSDNEFIMVDCTPSNLSFEDLVDTNSEDEYDYCDDAMSEGMQSEQHGYTCSFSCFSLTEDMVLEESASLSLLLPTEEEILRQNNDSDNDRSCGHHIPGILESSASDGSAGEEKREEKLPELEDGTSADLVAYESTDTNDSDIDAGGKSSSATASETEDFPNTSDSDYPNSSDSDSPAPPPSDAAIAKPQVGGRLSNKKRRKKMKLLKKAAAAAQAAARLTSDMPPSSSSSSATSSSSTIAAASKSCSKKSASKNTHTSRYHNRRVANIAVACATETLASYKAELLASPKTKVL